MTHVTFLLLAALFVFHIQFQNTDNTITNVVKETINASLSRAPEAQQNSHMLQSSIYSRKYYNAVVLTALHLYWLIQSLERKTCFLLSVFCNNVPQYM